MEKKQAIRAVVWDMGGVLLRTEDPEPRLQLAKHFRLSRKELENIVFGSECNLLLEAGKISLERYFQFLSEELNMTLEEVPGFIDVFFSGDRLDQELVAAIRSLRPVYRVGLLSNAWPSTRTLIEKRYRVLDVFDDTIFSAEVGLIKPDVAIYHLAAERLQVSPQEALFIDDMPRNVEGARAAGMQAILFTGTTQLVEQLSLLQSANE